MASEPHGPESPRPIRPGPVIGGIVLGILAALLTQAVLTIVLYGALNEFPVFAYAVYLLPGLIGVGLLLRPRTRQTGAGLLLGLAVGAIIAAGVCTVITAVAMSNAS